MNRRGWMTALTAVAALAAGVSGFCSQRAVRAGSTTETVRPGVLVAPGYTVKLVASGLSAPVGVAAASGGDLYVAETGRENGTPPRVLKLAPGKPVTTVAADFPAPLTGITWHQGKLYISYVGGVDVLDPATGARHTVLRNLPGQGDYPNGPAVIGPDEKLYIGIGSATNAGVVGPDNVDRGWVQAAPEFRDIACKPVKLRGINHSSPNPLTPDPQDRAATGAYSPFGRTTARFQVVPGALPCTGSILRANMDGTELELLAWGLRNPAGLAFSADGVLYTAMQGYEDRGSRPVVGDRDYLYRVEKDRWYGWPDYAGGRSVVEEEFQKPGAPISPLLAEQPEQPPLPVATFDSGSDATALLYPPGRFGLEGDVLVALMSAEQLPPAPRIVRLDPHTGKAIPFLENQASDSPQPAGTARLERPVALAAAPGGSVYVVDYGRTEAPDGRMTALPGTGRIWQIARAPGSGTGAQQRWPWAVVGLACTLAGAGLLSRQRSL